MTHRHRKKREAKDIQGQTSRYRVRDDLFTGDKVQCLAFTSPLLNFGIHEGEQDSDCNDEQYQNELKLNPATAKAKRKWKRLYEIIMDKRTQIPLKQMTLKAKHEQIIFDQM